MPSRPAHKDDKGKSKGKEKEKEREDDVGSVSTSRASLVSTKAGHVFDLAMRVPIRLQLRRPLRLAASAECRSWVRALGCSARQFPFRLKTRTDDELRMRAVGAAAGSGSDVVIFDLELGTTLRVVGLGAAIVQSLCISRPPAAARLPPVLAVGTNHGKVALFDLMSGDALAPAVEKYVHSGPIDALALCEGSPLLMFAATGPSISIWDLNHGALITSWTEHTSTIFCLGQLEEPPRAGPGPRYLASGGQDKSLQIYSIFKLAPMHSFPALHGGPLKCIDSYASKDYCWFVSGAADGSIRAVDVRCMEVCLRLQQPGGDGALAVQVLSQPRAPGLLTAGQRGRIYLWDLLKGQLLSTFPGHEGSVLAMQVALEPRWYFMSGGYDGSVRVWDVDLRGPADELLDAKVEEEGKTSEKKIEEDEEKDEDDEHSAAGKRGERRGSAWEGGGFAELRRREAALASDEASLASFDTDV